MKPAPLCDRRCRRFYIGHESGFYYLATRDEPRTKNGLPPKA